MSHQDYFEQLEALAEQLMAIAGFAILLQAFIEALRKDGIETEGLEKLQAQLRTHSDRARELLASLKDTSGDGL